MIDKNIDSGFRETMAERSNGRDQQNDVSQTRKANQKYVLNVDLGDVWRLSHFTMRVQLQSPP